ncbi:CPCC family cysteine-rich protein [Anderseniella sp. Alg231-50]|uniref:CPCC family cysteine-rich protein n=1 Tax=Anderseniella sp. Alg231-50 TaxID=1922226 RepID=UPI000D55C83C
MKSITRQKAIRLLAWQDMKRLNNEQRDDELVNMSAAIWEDHPSWWQLPTDLRQEIENREFDDAESSRFDEALTLSLELEYRGATNLFLLKQAKLLDSEVERVLGEFDELVSCPCCGLRTITNRGDYEICRVCWWEDDGTDNEDADGAGCGPNGDVNLTLGRVNFLRYGIFDPERKDLVEIQHPANKYPSGRKFEIDPGTNVIGEVGTGWKSKL